MIVSTVLLVSLCLILWKYFSKPSHYPPGFWGLPLLGYISLSRKSIFEQIFDARKWAGDILLWRIGVHKIVFLFDYETISKLFHAKELANRPEYFSITRSFDPQGNTGILGSNYKTWTETRRLSLQVLSYLGMGKSKLIEAMQYEASQFVESVLKSEKQYQPIPKALTVNVFNVTWKLVADKRYSGDDSMMHMHEELLNKAQGTVNGLVALDLFPWIRYIVPDFIIKNYIRKPADDAVQELLKYFQEIIDEHKKNLDVKNPKDYIDHYLIRMKNTRSTVLTEKNLLVTVADLYIGSSETGIATLQWVLFYIAAYPEVQRHLQKEIDSVLGKDNYPTESAYSKLHYCRSVICETQRMCTLLPTCIGRCNSKNLRINGVIIPKNAMILPVVKSCHFDEKIWKDPHEFRPERFLDEQNEFVPPRKGFLAFGIGKRACIGAAIAKIQLVIFLTTICQKFNILSHPERKISLVPEIDNFLFNLPCRSQLLMFEER